VLEITKETVKIYWQHAKKHRIFFYLVLFSIVGIAIGEVYTPILLKDFINILSKNIYNEQTYAELWRLLVLIFILSVSTAVFAFVRYMSMNRFESRTIASLYQTCFAYLHKHSFSFFNNSFIGSLVKKINRFVNAFENTSDNAILTFIPMFINLSFILFVLFKLNFVFAVGLIVFLAVYIGVNLWIISIRKPYDIKRYTADSRNSGILADTLTNNVSVKLFGGYSREVKNFQEKTLESSRLQQKCWDIGSYQDTAQVFFVAVIEILMYYYGLTLWKKQMLTIGDFVLLQAYLMIILQNIWNIGRAIRNLNTNLADAAEMTEILKLPHEIRDIKTAKPLKVTAGKIEFDSVDFVYNETRSIFRDLSFTIKPNEKVALVGPSGAGKSTLVKLLLRMHDVTRGKILIDGQKISSVTLESLWHNISMVPQDPILFHRSLMENIRYGKPDATDEEVKTASRLAHCHDFILELQDGYDTLVGERGIKLSGGERQRVAIARAILHNAPILILDEATSSLDSESESKIRLALDNLIKNKTVLVIAHRLSTIMKMDRIIVIKDGEIVEVGSHAQLLKKKNGLYSNLWNVQAGGFIS
jgi:ATP-binding cassette subfamily B protein